MKLKVVFEGYVEVEDLEDYSADSLADAALNLEQWIDGGDMPLEEVIASCKEYSYRIEPAE